MDVLTTVRKFLVALIAEVFVEFIFHRSQATHNLWLIEECYEFVIKSFTSKSNVRLNEIGVKGLP